MTARLLAPEDYAGQRAAIDEGVRVLQALRQQVLAEESSPVEAPEDLCQGDGDAEPELLGGTQ